jgi:hypothetical protein
MMLQRAIASGIAFAVMSAISGCAVRYDQAGVSRVGVFLWGFGDPPGVNWNLDTPRREIPELPAAPRRDLPPRESARSDASRDDSAVHWDAPERIASPIDDNPGRVPRSPDSPRVSASPRIDDRDGGAAKR